MNIYKAAVRPILFRFSADYAHDLTISAASFANDTRMVTGLLAKIYQRQYPELQQKIWGLSFDNPVGLAAGFDKNARITALMQALGFGYIEIGSITANACTGNPRPRSWRLPEDLSLINRLGLNNDGAKTVVRRIKKDLMHVPLGINIAKTHNPNISGKDALDDYKFSLEHAKEFADYITINISCPNTREGKTFEDPELLNQLLAHLEVGIDASDPPILVKFSVDLDPQHLTELLDITENFAVSGYVATNTSSTREKLSTDAAIIKKIGRGGLSGKAISDRSTKVIQHISDYTKKEKTIIGVGGVFTAQDAIEKIKAGADLIQLYTGLVYEGPSIAKTINRGIYDYLVENGLSHVYQIRS